MSIASEIEAPAAASSPAELRKAWLERRRSGIGGSDVAGILGLSPWASPWSIWADKVGLSPLDDEATEAQEAGQMAEPMLKAYFEKRTGLYVNGEQTECASSEQPWMRCTIDGWVFEHSQEIDDWMLALGVGEFKWTADSPKQWDEQIPLQYQCQAAWTLAVTDAQRLWFGVLHVPFGRPTFRVYQFARDEEEIRFVVARVTQFWNDHVLTGEPPPGDSHPATVDAVNHAWTADKGESVESGDLGRSLHAELVRRKATTKVLDDEVTALEVALKISMRTATSLVDGVDEKDKPVVLATWNPQQNSGFDVKALRADDPDLAEKYTTKSTIRVLRLKPPKGES